jgi:hypothetical protein
VIVIVDRHGLEEGADGIYGIPEAEYRRLFPSHVHCPLADTTLS